MKYRNNFIVNVKNNKIESFALTLLIIYILSFSLRNLFISNIVGRVFRLPELIAIPLICIGVIYLLQRIGRIKFNLLDLSVTGYLVSAILAYAIHPQVNGALGGILTLSYFVFLYLITRVLTQNNLNSALIINAFIVSALLAAIIGILGYFAIYFGYNSLNEYYINSPIFGNTYRAFGLIGHTSIFVHFISLALLLLIGSKRTNRTLLNKYFYFAISLLVLAILLSKVKTIGIIIPLAILLYLRISNYKNSTLRLLSIPSALLILAVLFVSHFMPFKENKIATQKPEYFTEYRPINLNHEWSLMITKYTQLKNESIEIFKDNFPFGIGFKCFAKYNIGEIHNTLLLVPHSSHFGTTAELGLFGLLAYFGIFYFSYLYLRDNSPTENFKMTGLAVLAFIFVEGFLLDISHLHFEWILLGLVPVQKVIDNAKISCKLM